MPSYMIRRFYQDDRPTEVVRRGLTEAEAQEWCRLDNTHGVGWFDGYDQEAMRVCPECGSGHLSLTLDTEVMATGVPDGRLKSNEIRAILVVGCDECSATVEVVRDTDRLILMPPEEES